ncbi:hypothetical protein C8J56DRAFT_1081714 [Mycena floridula]|nr:hypothetical protein C8J56DRAFT_1081714 [Mycena floridula]
MHKVAIFWDYENLSVPRAVYAPLVVANIRASLVEYGQIISFVAYTAYESHRRHLQQAEIAVEMCPHMGLKNVVDRRIIEDATNLAGKSVAKELTLVLISNDGDFGPRFSRFGREGFAIVVICDYTGSIRLRSIPSSRHIPWRDILGQPQAKDGSEEETSAVIPQTLGKRERIGKRKRSVVEVDSSEPVPVRTDDKTKNQDEDIGDPYIGESLSAECSDERDDVEVDCSSKNQATTLSGTFSDGSEDDSSNKDNQDVTSDRSESDREENNEEQDFADENHEDDSEDEIEQSSFNLIHAVVDTAITASLRRPSVADGQFSDNISNGWLWSPSDEFLIFSDGSYLCAVRSTDPQETHPQSSIGRNMETLANSTMELFTLAAAWKSHIAKQRLRATSKSRDYVNDESEARPRKRRRVEV